MWNLTQDLPPISITFHDFAQMFDKLAVPRGKAFIQIPALGAPPSRYGRCGISLCGQELEAACSHLGKIGNRNQGPASEPPRPTPSDPCCPARRHLLVMLQHSTQQLHLGVSVQHTNLGHISHSEGPTQQVFSATVSTFAVTQTPPDLQPGPWDYTCGTHCPWLFLYQPSSCL